MMNSAALDTESRRSDNNRILIMFVRRDDGRYIIYKLFDEFLQSSWKHDISPLIIFKDGVLPDCLCSFVYISPYFYIVGAKKEDVFTLDKDLLISLKPSERERGAALVKPIHPMTADKNIGSLAFAYQNNLYVIAVYSCPKLPPSSKTSNYEFEVYSPIDKTWRSLGNSPLSICHLPVYLQSHLVIASVVYFTTSLNVVMSFDLKAEMWRTVFDPYGVLHVYVTSSSVFSRPTFHSQTLVVGNTIFGLFERTCEGYSDVCASSSWNPHEDLFLRPDLAPDQKFLEDAFHVPLYFVTDLPDWSRFIFAWDEDTLCVVNYGSNMMTHASAHNNYAQLSLFKITADSYQRPININTCPPLGFSDGREFSYAREEDHVNCFKADLCGCTRLFIKTKKQFTHGIVCSCIFVDH